MMVLFLCIASFAAVFIVIWRMGKADVKRIPAMLASRSSMLLQKTKEFLQRIRDKKSDNSKNNPAEGSYGNPGKNPAGKNYVNPGNSLIEYGVYQMTAGEKARYFLIAFLVLVFAGYLFFNNIIISLAAGCLALFYPSIKKKDLLGKRKRILNMQFKDALYSISSSLSAGRSAEGAFKAALDDLRILYPDKDAYIIRELEQINRRIDMNDTLENALMDFARRSDIEDIKNFADVFIICKSTGGNLVEVIRNTYFVLNQKIEIKNEIDVLIAQQKLNQKILNIMPFGLLALIITSSPDYVRPLYSPAGHAAMAVVLILLAVSYVIGSKITDIKI